MTPEAQLADKIDWSKPIEYHDTDGGVYEAHFVGFDKDGCAVVQRTRNGQYLGFRRLDGSLKGGPSHQFIRNR